MTWGDAWICDPWSNKVYPAATYLKNLKNYYYRTEYNRKTELERVVNYCEDFYPDRHRVEPKKNLNLQFLRTPTACLNALKKLNIDLAAIQKRLLDKYGADDDKYAIIDDKISTIQSHIEKIETMLRDNEGIIPFRKTLAAGIEAVQFSSKNQDTLFKYRRHESFLSFFGYKPVTTTQLLAADKNFQNHLRNTIFGSVRKSTKKMHHSPKTCILSAISNQKQGISHGTQC